MALKVFIISKSLIQENFGPLLKRKRLFWPTSRPQFAALSTWPVSTQTSGGIDILFELRKGQKMC